MIETSATRAAAESGIEHRVLTYPRVESLEEAAAARGVPIASIIKTLAIRRGDDDHILVLVGGDRALDWKKLRNLLGVSRLSLVDEDQLVAVTGYPRGAVTPFGTTRSLPVYVDAASAHLDEMSLGGGTFGQAIHLRAADVVAHFNAVVADMSKDVLGTGY